MQETEEDRREIRRVGRRDLLHILPIAAVMVFAGWWVSRWVRARYGLDMDLSRSLAMLGIGVLVMPIAFYVDRKRRRSGGLMPRIEWLMARRADRSRARTRWIWFVALGPMLVIQILTLADGPRGAATRAPHETWTLVWILATFMICGQSMAWRSDASRDELTQAQTLLATQSGFTTLMLLGLAALILEAYRPGTLVTSLKAVLIVGILVPQVTLMLQERGSAAAEADSAIKD